MTTPTLPLGDAFFEWLKALRHLRELPVAADVARRDPRVEDGGEIAVASAHRYNSGTYARVHGVIAIADERVSEASFLALGLRRQGHAVDLMCNAADSRRAVAAAVAFDVWVISESFPGAPALAEEVQRRQPGARLIALTAGVDPSTPTTPFDVRLVRPVPVALLQQAVATATALARAACTRDAKRAAISR